MSGEPIDLQTVLLRVFPFSLGIYLSEKNGLYAVKQYMKDKRIIKFIIYAVLIAGVIIVRQWPKTWPGYNYLPKGIRIDGILGILVIMVFDEYLADIGWLRKIFTVLGEYSFNMFLIHTLIYTIFFHDFFYVTIPHYVAFADHISLAFRPLAMILSLIVITFLTAAVLEKIKEISGYNKLYNRFSRVKFVSDVIV